MSIYLITFSAGHGLCHQKQLKMALKEAYALEQEANNTVNQAAMIQYELENKCKSQANVINVLQKAVTDNAQAVGMLKYDKSKGYKAELTAKQERLIDSIANTSSTLMKQQERHDLAANIDKNVCISDNIESEMTRLEQEERARERIRTRTRCIERDDDFER